MWGSVERQKPYPTLTLDIGGTYEHTGNLNKRGGLWSKENCCLVIERLQRSSENMGCRPTQVAPVCLRINPSLVLHLAVRDLSLNRGSRRIPKLISVALLIGRTSPQDSSDPCRPACLLINPSLVLHLAVVIHR